jgi:hypothetical protein
MILEIIDSMPGPFNRAHAQRISCFIAFGEPVFIHPASWVVFNRFFLQKCLTGKYGSCIKVLPYWGEEVMVKSKVGIIE